MGGFSHPISPVRSTEAPQLMEMTIVSSFLLTVGITSTPFWCVSSFWLISLRYHISSTYNVNQLPKPQISNQYMYIYISPYLGKRMKKEYYNNHVHFEDSESTGIWSSADWYTDIHNTWNSTPLWEPAISWRNSHCSKWRLFIRDWNIKIIKTGVEKQHCCCRIQEIGWRWGNKT